MFFPPIESVYSYTFSIYRHAMTSPAEFVHTSGAPRHRSGLSRKPTLDTFVKLPIGKLEVVSEDSFCFVKSCKCIYIEMEFEFDQKTVDFRSAFGVLR